MPGIYGTVRPNACAPELLDRDLARMGDVMQHRPDYRRTCRTIPPAAMGIIGTAFLNPGTQPVVSRDGKLALVFDGELFEPARALELLPAHERPEAPRTDAEIVLLLIERFGPDIVPRLAGGYVGFVYDFASRAGYLFNDRMGLRGAYYALLPDGTLAFASEFKAVALLEGFRGTLDTQAVGEFLNVGFPFFQRTFFQQVKFLPNASLLTFRDGQVSLTQYWNFDPVDTGAGWTFEDAVEEGARLWLESLEGQHRQPGRYGLLLSGGMDSRTIAAGFAARGYPLTTFSLGSGANPETALAARVSGKLGLEHHQLDIPGDFLARHGEAGIYLTDGMFPCEHMHWLSQLAYMSRHADVLMLGHLGNLTLGGWYLTSGMIRPMPMPKRGAFLANRVIGKFPPWLGMALSENFRRTLQEQRPLSQKDYADGVDARGPEFQVERMAIANGERRFLGAGNNAMFGWGATPKYPFGDYRLLDFLCRCPELWRAEYKLYKSIFCRAFPELIGVPMISAKTRFLPMTLDPSAKPLHIGRVREARFKLDRWVRFLAGRLSAGRFSLRDRNTYVQYVHWYRTVPALRNWISSILLDPRTLDRGYFDRDGIRRLLWTQMAKGYPFEIIGQLVTFECWNRFFVDREAPARPLEFLDRGPRA